MMRVNFEGPEYSWSMFRKWEVITLDKTIVENPGKSIDECVQIMFDRLCYL